MSYRIRSAGYDPESDELDLLIDTEQPHAAEAVPLDGGVYIRRDFETGAIVGAFIRGYRQFARDIAEGKVLTYDLAEPSLREVFNAILVWQREVGSLSNELASHLGTWPPQDELLEVLLERQA